MANFEKFVVKTLSALQMNATLKTLSLHGTTLNTGTAWTCMQKLIELNQCLISISLQECQIGDFEMRDLNEALKKNKTLQVLDISRLQLIHSIPR